MLEDHQVTPPEQRDFSGSGLLLVLAISAAVVFDFFQSRTFTASVLLAASVILAPIILSASHLHPALKLDKHRALMLTLYHIAVASLVIFVVPTLSPYLIVWVIIAYLSEYYYQVRGVAISLGLLAVTMIAGIWHQNPQITVETLAIALVWYVLLSTIILMLSRIMLGNREQRRDLSKKILHAEYEHERMVNLINSMSEAVLAVDDQGVISVFNAAALDLLDTNVEIAGQNIKDLLKLYDANKQPVDPMALAAQTRYLARRSDLILHFTEDDAICLEIDISRTALSYALDQKAGFTFILRDITEQKSLDEQKNIFISQVSHELRTPITVAEANVSMAQLLFAKPGAQQAAIGTALDKAHRQVIFLAEMVNDLSTLSRAERTDKPMEIETFNVAELLHELGSEFAPRAAEKHLEFKVIAPGSLPKLTTSRLYLTEILQNLMTNAIKYTQAGRVTVQATVKDRNELIILVADTGIGIAKSEQDKVFDKFWRSEDPLTRQTNGTGLGLYITNQLARRIGAAIDMESELKKGSVFSLKLPIVTNKQVDQEKVVKNEVENLLD